MASRMDAVHQHPPHGLKRHASDDLNNEQPLTKRLELLDLERTIKPFEPILSRARAALRQPLAETNGDSMQVDDTKHRIFISNLDDELSDSDSTDEKIVLLPELEKQMTKIPKTVLTDNTSPTSNTELVLYSIPNSLSIPEEEDSVRKAIIESRARAREKQQTGVSPDGAHDDDVSVAVGDVELVAESGGMDIEEDPDAMDIE